LYGTAWWGPGGLELRANFGGYGEAQGYVRLKGPHANLSRRGIRRALPTEDQGRDRLAIQSSGQGHRDDYLVRENRKDRRRQDFRVRPRPCGTYSHQRNRRRRDLNGASLLHLVTSGRKRPEPTGDSRSCAHAVGPTRRYSAPGGICLSDNAYQQIKGKLAVDISNMGEHP
jgi:hypothetical protein